MEGEAEGEWQRRSSLRSTTTVSMPLSDCTNFVSDYPSSPTIVTVSNPKINPIASRGSTPRPSSPRCDENQNVGVIGTNKQIADKGKGKEKTPAVPFSTYSANMVVNSGNKRKEYKDLRLLEPHTVPPKKINFDGEVERREVAVMEGKAAQSQRRSTLRNRMNRKPLSDCTNTIFKPQSQSSPATRPEPKPCSQPNTHPNPATSASATPPTGSGTNSADPSTPLPPSRPSSPPGGDGDGDDTFEIRTVYTRRQTANTRKGKRRALPVHFSSYSANRIVNAGKRRTEYEDIGLPEPHTVPLTKKQHSRRLRQDASEQSLQDYIQQQRAYFDEVDAFELSEEEVSGNDSD